MRIKNGIEFVKEWKALKKKQEVYVNGYSAGQVAEIQELKRELLRYNETIKKLEKEIIKEKAK